MVNGQKSMVKGCYSTISILYFIRKEININNLTFDY